MSGFLDKVKQLQWDDHRYYHQCRINQTLHLVSAISFRWAYLMLCIDPAVSGLIGWLVGMVTRQSGHIFFEPRGFDPVHGVTDAYKESIKVGYNMRRKGILIGVWLSLPLLLLASPSLSGMIEPSHDRPAYSRCRFAWLALGPGLLFRTAHLFLLRGPAWGLAWAVKILLDPFHNVALYRGSPMALLRGQRFDPIETAAAPSGDT
ncbi:MAG: hypothetical protein IPP50_11710 [Piscinibacter sp.]|nr:hypothetical protein [Piscinibacter sp.]